MRRTLRKLATAQPFKYLEAGTPTGLCGLFTHASPRSTLLYTYATTLEKLAAFPESSLYRQSTEALTKHRMEIVQAVQPRGIKDWLDRTRATVELHPEAFQGGPDEPMKTVTTNGRQFIVMKPIQVRDDITEEWDGEEDEGPVPEGMPIAAQTTDDAMIRKNILKTGKKKITLEPEPQLTIAQIEEIESKIGAGLIEEVIQVAEGELKLADLLLKAQVWEDLEEKPVEGQWTYFTRDSGMPTPTL